MPIKIPKSFARRKSSGSALEEVQNAPAPSFKVFERPPAGNRSWDGTNALKKPSQVHIYGATENDNAAELFHVNKDDSRNRGSGGTNNSASTAPYGSAASSARFSSSSTIPSSTDISNESHANSMVSAQRPFQDIPVPPAQRSRGWSIKNAGRTFSFATKQKNEGPVESFPPPRPSPTAIQETIFTPGRRERATTASTASTATPPRLLEGDMAFGDSDLDNFGNMFDSIGRRSNRASAKIDLPPLPASASEAPASQISSPLPPPLDIHRTREAASSPYSWASHDSRDGLMGSPSPTHFQSATSPSPPVRRKALPTSEDMPASQASLSPVRGTGSYVRGQNGPLLTKSPSPVEDEGAGLLADSIHRDSSQQNTYFDARRKFESVRPKLVKTDDSDNEELLFSTQSQNHPKISRTGPSKAKPSGHIRQPNADAVDLSPVDSVSAGAQSEANASAQQKPGESGHHNDDEETAKESVKQEADLRINRQTMMRVTESFSGPSSNNAGESGRLTSMSSPELSRMSHLTVNTGVSSHSGKSSGTDEEDEDVPLGILAAHGFPNKNKPPGRLHPSLVHANLRSSGPLSAPPASVSGDSRAGSRGNLPVFARNLPQDPYNGSSLGNPPSRGQLSMGGQSFGGVPAGQVHPSGLVGVIAGEERARAMRRGSPNQQGNHENLMAGQHPGMMGRSQTMGNMSAMNGYPSPGMPGMMYPQALSPGDQAQIQMAQQMNQMMQIQMQFMQQMSQWQQNGQMGQMPQPGMMGMPGDTNYPNQRPFSMPLPDSSQHNGRAMSLTPGMTSQWNRNSSYAPSMGGGQGGYAPSIAPSERNIIGMASRYRPVSIAESNKPTNDRASTFTSGAYQRWTQNNEQGRLSPSNTNTTVRPTSTSALGQNPVKADDEDDDQGWADMKKKRDKKKALPLPLPPLPQHTSPNNTPEPHLQTNICLASSLLPPLPLRGRLHHQQRTFRGEYLFSYLKRHRFHVLRQEVPQPAGSANRKKRFNVFAWPRDALSSDLFSAASGDEGEDEDDDLGGSAPKVILTSHIHTVPPFIPYLARSPESLSGDYGGGDGDGEGERFNRSDILIFGRGTVDARACVAAQPTHPPFPIALLFVTGEESLGNGMKTFSTSSLHTALSHHYTTLIFGEPTELDLASGHKGFLLFTLTAHGLAAYSGYPWLGRNANTLLVRVLAEVKRLGELEAARGGLARSRKYGNSTVNVGVITGEVAANVIPEHAVVEVAVRLAAGTVGDVRRVIVEAFTGPAYAPVDLDADVPGVGTVTVDYGTDVPNWAMSEKDGEGNGKGVKRYLYGPGSILVAHGEREGLRVGQLEAAVEGYRRLIRWGLGMVGGRGKVSRMG